MGVFEGPGSPCAQDLCSMCPRFIDNVLDAVLPSIPVLRGIRKLKMFGSFDLFPRKFKMFGPFGLFPPESSTCSASPASSKCSASTPMASPDPTYDVDLLSSTTFSNGGANDSSSPSSTWRRPDAFLVQNAIFVLVQVQFLQFQINTTMSREAQEYKRGGDEHHGVFKFIFPSKFSLLFFVCLLGGVSGRLGPSRLHVPNPIERSQSKTKVHQSSSKSGVFCTKILRAFALSQPKRSRPGKVL